MSRAVLLSSAAVLALALAAPAAAETIAITNARILTAGPAGEIANGTVVITDGRIASVGSGGAPLKEIDATPGNGIFPSDAGGVIRRVAYSVDDLKSLSVASVEVAEKRRVQPGDFPPEKRAWIDFYGGQQTLRTVAFSDVVQSLAEGQVLPTLGLVRQPARQVHGDVHGTHERDVGRAERHHRRQERAVGRAAAEPEGQITGHQQRRRSGRHP